MGSLRGLWLLASLLFAFPHVSGATTIGEISFSAPGSFRASGNGSILEVPHGVYLATYGLVPASGATLQATTAQLEVTILERSIDRLILADGSHIALPQDEIRRTRFEFMNANTSTSNWHFNHTLVWWTTEPSAFRFENVALQRVEDDPAFASERVSRNSREPFRNNTFWPNAADIAGSGRFYVFDATLLNGSIAGGFGTYTTGTTISVVDERGNHSFWTGSRIMEREVLPSGDRIVRYHTVAAILKGAGVVEWSRPPSDVVIAASEAALYNVSAASLPLAAGELTREGGPVIAFDSASHVDMQGSFDLRFRGGESPPGARAHIRVAGEIVAYSENKAEWRRLDSVVPTAIAVAAIAGAGLLYLAVQAREFLLHVVGRNVADPLGHETRKRIIDLLLASPGFSHRELSSALGVNKWLIRHHVGLMVRAGLISPINKQRTLRFRLNTGRLAALLERTGQSRIPTDGRNPASLSAPPGHIALLRHPARATMVSLLVEGGPQTFTSLRRNWPIHAGMCPSVRVFSYHANLLAREGVILRTRKGRSVFWRAENDAARALPRYRDI